MDKMYERLVLTSDEFGDDLYTTLGKVLEILFKAGYECQVYDDDYGIIVINYNYGSWLNFGNANLEWLYEDERNLIFDLRDQKAEEGKDDK